MSFDFEWTEEAREDYLFWLKTNKQVFLKINSLLENIQISPFEGLGKPKPLNQNLTGFWSRRITKEHRLIYQIKENTIYINQCRYHYQK